MCRNAHYPALPTPTLYQTIQTRLSPRPQRSAQSPDRNLSLPPSPAVLPASFSNSALPSTAHSPAASCFLSASSPPSTMFVTGPYANETQLVSPPVFSTFTTEPSTAPLTPPPELAHLTNPSSPDVPYAHFLRNTSVSWDPPKSNFFCPETFAQFYVDQSSFSNAGGRLSISRETDAYQSRQSKSCRADAEELEAYRASFGFSVDEIMTTASYVEITDVSEDSFSIAPAALRVGRAGLNRSNSVHFGVPVSCDGLEDQGPKKRFGISGRSYHHNNHNLSDDDSIYSNKGSYRIVRKYQFGSSNSDAEIEYRRASSLRERRNWRES
ncbi:uncharacterized protein at1g76660 [Phtheirospermum japonicum]|uniref:Uncharacterized protein at1g76660 n=1 Tax=Phtheirospermum japonicum TaxID=374723 RepID=A0A830AWS9_9LAMI|nr:uncharacterized protein at1g76660 [Phtheirospermum japonicum]